MTWYSHMRWWLLWTFVLARTGVGAATLFAVEENGSRSRRINIVFLSEGYTTADLPKFAGHVQAVMNFLFTKDPWHQYRSYCNVYRIEVASNESGCDNGNTSGPNALRDTYFSAAFDVPATPQVLRIPNSAASRAFTLLNTYLPEYDVPIVLVNDTKYGGSGGQVAVASVNASSAAIIEHELGHSFAILADEYDLQYPAFNPVESINVTKETDRNKLKWRHWVEAATPVPTPETAAFDDVVGLFEGAAYRTNGWYRPHNNSLMRNLNRPCGAVNREQFILSFYSRVGPIDASAPAAVLREVLNNNELLNFSVTPKKPSEGALAVTWSIDGIVQAGATSNTFQISSSLLGNGSHSVTATVRDPTAMVRLDTKGLLEDVVTWPLLLLNQTPQDLASWRLLYGDDSATPANDGLPNLIKYALGLDPNHPALISEKPFLSLIGTELLYSVPRQIRRTDVDYLVEFSSDLSVWSTEPGVVVSDTATLLSVRDSLPVGEDSRRFVRLRVRER